MLPLVFIHGMYLNSASWADWLEVAVSRGYEAQLGHLTFGDVVASLAARVAELPEKPVLAFDWLGGNAR